MRVLQCCVVERDMNDGTDSLLYFIKNSVQLAGTFCHQGSHTIHHDSIKLVEKER